MFKDKELTRKVSRLVEDTINNASEISELRHRCNRLNIAYAEQQAKFDRDTVPLRVQLADQQAHINTLAEAVVMLLDYLNLVVVKEAKCLKAKV